MFETFNVPAMYVAIQAVLSLYASGRTTGAYHPPFPALYNPTTVFTAKWLPFSLSLCTMC